MSRTNRKGIKVRDKQGFTMRKQRSFFITDDQHEKASKLVEAGVNLSELFRQVIEKAYAELRSK